VTVEFPACLAQTTHSRYAWDKRDVMLYALAIGMADDPGDRRELDFVYEERLKVFPTFPVLMGFNHRPLQEIGMDYASTVHAGIALTVHREIPTDGVAEVDGSVLWACDKGAAKGGLFTEQLVVRIAGEDAPLATTASTTFSRADGGFGGTGGSPPETHQPPDRSADRWIDLPTLPKQALLYRLTGDRNPLHVDPEAAKIAGFDAPILHGLCTYAICCRAVMQAYADNDPRRIRHHALRFSAPVYPGEIIRVHLWRDANDVSFEASVPARGVTVVTGGKTILTD